MSVIIRRTYITVMTMIGGTITNPGTHSTIDGLHLIIAACGIRGITDDPSTTIAETLCTPIIENTPGSSLGKMLLVPIPTPCWPEKIIPHKVKYPNSSKGNLETLHQ